MASAAVASRAWDLSARQRCGRTLDEGVRGHEQRNRPTDRLLGRPDGETLALGRRCSRGRSRRRSGRREAHLARHGRTAKEPSHASCLPATGVRRETATLGHARARSLCRVAPTDGRRAIGRAGRQGRARPGRHAPRATAFVCARIATRFGLRRLAPADRRRADDFPALHRGVDDPAGAAEAGVPCA